MAKDLFSQQASSYARYRPSYPPELFEYILQFVREKKLAWDCATGNGQAAVFLSEYFEQVEATDISEAQLANAVLKENVNYSVCAAEQTPFAENSFDLITVAQAYHWFDSKRFYTEATRVGKPGAVVAIWGYNLLQTGDEALDALIKHFYKDIVGPFWDAERKFVDDAYQTVSFDFDPLPAKDFFMTLEWSREQFTGYLQSWSAVQHYTKKHQRSPLTLIVDDLERLWMEPVKAVRFPVFMRMGRIRK